MLTKLEKKTYNKGVNSMPGQSSAVVLYVQLHHVLVTHENEVGSGQIESSPSLDLCHGGCTTQRQLLAGWTIFCVRHV